ncbi:MAG TPA: hypothetical protein VMR77_01045 [Patescibacteria group bacterium]|nr:hypothetical protein [Patescibacteria group bacterium]
MTREIAGPENYGGNYHLTREGLTPTSILEDNQSPRAIEGRAAHAANKAAKRLILVSQCCDSRNMSTEPEREAVIRSAGGAPDFPSFAAALADPSYCAVVFEGHFTGKEEIEGESPEGCKAREVKGEQLKGAEPKSDIEKWVHEHLAHSDLILDLFERSEQVLRLSGKDLLLVARDHLDQTIYPVMAFLKEPLVPPTIDMQEYDPAIVYKAGIPHLTSGQLKDSVFADYLNDYYSKRFPELHRFGLLDRDSRLTQNPKVLLITTETMPVELWLPKLAEQPGKIFVETLARTRDSQGGRIRISERDLDCVIRETDLPLHYSKLDTILVLTEDLVQSERVLSRLKRKQKFQAWMENSAHQLIVGQIDNGVIASARTSLK